MRIRINRHPVLEKMSKDVFYVPQDNYEIVNIGQPLAWNQLYCDSATSCIVVIVTGTSKEGWPAVAISHLSRPDRFDRFLQLVEETFADDISFFAHGANPPQPGCKDGQTDYTALRNLNIVNQWVLAHSICCDGAVSPLITQATLLFGEGDPSKEENNLDCYGIDLSDPAQPVVSNRRFELDLDDRDHSGGLQSIFCSYGLKIDPPVVLVCASKAFDLSTPGSLARNKPHLVAAAHADNYESYENMTDAEILAQCSSTPDAEVPWFCDTIRESAKYVRLNYKPKKE